MKSRFLARAKPKTFDHDDIIGPSGHLRHDVFMRAVSHLNKKSTPGFPFFNVRTNEDVNLMQLYDEVDTLLLRWLKRDHDWTQFDPRNPNDAILLYREGWVLPSRVFVKGEATSESKMARLVFGTSVVLQTLGRIIFGDYLSGVVESWGEQPHKVGIDFSSEQGLRKFTEFMDKHFFNEGNTDTFESDDIQGWDFMPRQFFHESWHEAYMDVAGATEFHRVLQTAYMHALTYTLCVDSDLVLHHSPFFHRQSGEVLTHLQNCDERGTVSLMDIICSSDPLTWNFDRLVCKIRETENGDDCIEKANDHRFSRKLGIVITDCVTQTPLEVNFCSQVFFRAKKGDVFKRRPDSLHKLMYHLIASNSAEQIAGIMSNLVDHPAYNLMLSIRVLSGPITA